MADVKVQSLITGFTEKIDSFTPTFHSQDVGQVIEAGDGICRVSGLSNVGNASWLNLPTVCVALSLAWKNPMSV